MAFLSFFCCIFALGHFSFLWHQRWLFGLGSWCFGTGKDSWEFKMKRFCNPCVGVWIWGAIYSQVHWGKWDDWSGWRRSNYFETRPSSTLCAKRLILAGLARFQAEHICFILTKGSHWRHLEIEAVMDVRFIVHTFCFSLAFICLLARPEG